MKVKLRFMLGLLAFFAGAACSDEEKEPPIVAVESVHVSPSSISVERDKTYQLNVEISPKEATQKTVVWSSSNSQVVAVSEEGLVTGVSKGSATITAAAGGKKATCQVTVKISPAIIEGDKATVQLDGTTAKELEQTIKKTAAAGVNKFVMKGNYSALGSYTSNIFRGIVADVIDLSQVTGWPKDSDGLVKLPNDLFYCSGNSANFTGIKEVILPNEIQSIGQRAFCGCTNLRRIEASGIQKLGDQVFQKCKQLTEVQMPKLTEMGRSCFSSSGLKKADFPQLTTVGGNAFWMCNQLTEANLPNVTVLGSIAPENASSRTGANAFADCTKLEKVYLPKVTLVGDMAFNSCRALKEIDLPEAAEIGEAAMMSCSALVKVRLPKATQFRRDVFTSCKALSQLFLLAEGSISVKNTTFGPADKVTKMVDLTLHPNKQSEVKDPFVGTGKEWKSHNWKSISFSEK